MKKSSKKRNIVKTILVLAVALTLSSTIVANTTDVKAIPMSHEQNGA